RAPRRSLPGFPGAAAVGLRQGLRLPRGRVSSFSKRLSLFLRVAVSIGLVAFMVSKLDTSNMLRFLRRADVALVALTLLAVLADRALMAVRRLKLVEALRVHAA